MLAVQNVNPEPGHALALRGSVNRGVPGPG